MLTGLGAGLALVIFAVVLGLFVLIVIWLRQLPRNTSTASEPTATVSSPDSSPLNEAVLIVQIGGRVEYVNDLAREWFGLREGVGCNQQGECSSGKSSHVVLPSHLSVMAPLLARRSK